MIGLTITYKRKGWYMHTTRINNTQFIHDGDFGEDITIVINSKGMVVPTLDLIGIVAEMKRRQKISELEDMSAAEILGVKV